MLQILSALPGDAVLFHADFDFRRNEYHLAFWSEEFEHVPIGREAPTITARIDAVNLRAGIGDPPLSCAGDPVESDTQCPA